MKVLVLLLFLLPLASNSQTKSDYEKAMLKFQTFYNASQGDSINAMFGREWDVMKSVRPLWTNSKTAEYVKEYGQLKSFKYIGIDTTDPDKVYVFETMFSKAGKKNTSLSLDKDFALGTFRFITSSESINAMQKRQKNNP